MGDVQFEQPDLRQKNHQRSWSTYQHPRTGEQVPSVTSISGSLDKSGFLGPWHAANAANWAAANMHMLAGMGDPDAIVDAIKGGAKRMSEEGRNLGSLAHNTIEALSLGETVDIPPEVEHHVAGWREWCTKYVKRFVIVEQTVWSHQFKYAGTMDVLAEFHDGTYNMVDYKTGKEVHADACLQLNALARADVIVTTEGEFPMPRVDGLGVLHLPAPVMTPGGKLSVRGKWSYRRIPMREVDWQTFQALRFAWDWEHIHSKDSIGGKETVPGWEER